jgi:uncharacterized protein (TIGR02217 family)
MSLPIFQNPPSVAWNNTKTQRWDTKIQKYGRGGRKTLSRWAYPEWVLDCAFTCLDDSEIEYMAGFFASLQGQAKPFLWKDLEDYKQENVRVGMGDGETTGFQLVRNFANLFVEPVYGIVENTLQVFADETPIDIISEDEGWIELVAPAPGVVLTATFEYYWRVAFDDDEVDWSNFWYGFYKFNKFRMVTVR